MAEISDTELVATQADIISSIVQDTLKQKAMILPWVTNYSSQVGKGAKSVSIARRTEFAAADKAENTALTAQEMTFAVDKIDLDKKKAILASVELIPEKQAMVNVRSQIIQEQANELALQVDKDLLVEIRLVSLAAPDHLIPFVDTPTGTLQKSDILAARALLLNANVMADDQWVMGINPDKETDLLNIADFIRNDSYGSPEGLRRGVLGKVFNFNVLVHTEIADTELLFWHPSHVGYASQTGATFDEDKDLPNIAQQMLLFQVYGQKVLDSGKRGVRVFG